MPILIITFVLVFGLLVFVHEFGHFIVAKKSGVKVEEFGFGFPPKLWSVKKGETVYSLNLIPLGGFVKLYGESGEAPKNPKSFSHLSVGKRSKIVLAGVLMNFMLAVVLFIALNATGIPVGSVEEPVVDAGATIVTPHRIIVATVEKDSPADQAGIAPSDRLISGNGVPFVSAKSVSEFTRANAGKEVELLIGSNGSEKAVKVNLRSVDSGKAPLGVEPVGIMRVRYPIFVSIVKGVESTLSIFLAILIGVGKIFAALFTAERAADGVSGPIGIGVLLNQYIKLGLPYVVYFMSILSVTLAVFNVLPIPALDGGRQFFLLLERIRGKKVRAELENAIHSIGFIALLLLVLLISYVDVRRFF